MLRGQQAEPSVRVERETYQPPPSIENLLFVIEVENEKGKLVEVLGRLAGLDPATSASAPGERDATTPNAVTNAAAARIIICRRMRCSSLARWVRSMNP